MDNMTLAKSPAADGAAISLTGAYEAVIPTATP
jgi:hypothetical protein